MVVQRDQIQDQLIEAREARAQQGLRAAGAFLERQPDHGLAPRFREALGDGRRCGRRQGQYRGRVGREFQKAAPGNGLEGNFFKGGGIFVFSIVIVLITHGGCPLLGDLNPADFQREDAQC